MCQKRDDVKVNSEQARGGGRGGYFISSFFYLK